ncbi:MAG TPA: 50S ribosomal protein L10 [Candidatus Hydrogenedentes bacterium]|nr:50S ribosomal protein L10 [Candidatus Hydrogenedentota bacterium]HIJ74902.1 50S ribosomal protein L10 [Candidatus Hydrogenedentota bacterium]
MRKTEKAESVAELKQCIETSRIAILTKYKGINVEQVTELRRMLREQHVQFKVFKNSLARRALDELALSDAAGFMDGPTAWAFCEDPVRPAKILKDFAKEVQAIGMNGGILEGQIISLDQLRVLADLPPRDVLLAQVVGTIAMPLRKLAGTLNALPRNLVNVLDQIRKQKEEAGVAA